MRSRKGFTLIELMVVILIVAVLAAVIVPLLISRIEKARMSEGKAIAGQIATALRASAAEDGDVAGTVTLEGTSTYNADGTVATTGLGFKSAELMGKFYTMTGTSVDSASIDTETGLMDYVITVASRDTDKCPDVTLTCVDNVTTITP